MGYKNGLKDAHARESDKVTSAFYLCIIMGLPMKNNIIEFLINSDLSQSSTQNILSDLFTSYDGQTADWHQ